ncbi:hypothetical protein DFR50_13429 [Roseiarcus fermentans]|uniref:Cytochrome c domain-containing protein n=1 Tax=Roseiarcus fermentans TaxID=1473586 RepID=A0A366EUR0_9HYPH|nr:hypothetical protein [Roseiarcus fermentans]RBP05666.1 hypothetical protein DFR50_13429 [Roseiarcus fermentans]
MGTTAEPLNATARTGRGRLAAFVCAALGALAAGAGGLTLGADPAEALPAFARQTGHACADCHTLIPELRPFGRRFKIGGYTLTGGDWQGPPLSAFYQIGGTRQTAPYDYTAQGLAAAQQNGLANPQANAAPAGLHTNANLTSQQVSVFVAGKLYENLGAFIGVAADPTFGGVGLDQSDVRYADTATWFGKDTIWGIDVNNSPTVEDPWNTLPSWGYPQINSTIASGYTIYQPPLTKIEGAYQTNVGGAGVYTFWNDMVYAAVLAYKGLPPNWQPGVAAPASDALTNLAPYWRLAIEPHWGQHYLMVGTFGMYGRLAPDYQWGVGTNNYLDVGFDSQYQYDGDQYSLTVKLTDIIERQQLNASYFQGAASNRSDSLNSFKINQTFVWDHTYLFGLGYFNITGSHDCNLYGSAVAPCLNASIIPGGGTGNSVVGSPNGDGLIAEVAYSPFMKGAPGPYDDKKWNMRVGLQFTSYFHLYGGANNFDGSYLGNTHNASGNNSLFAYMWIVF